jgi:hypothetical protein
MLLKIKSPCAKASGDKKEKMYLLKIKKIIEENPVALATIMDRKKPNAAALAFAKVVSDKEILLTDNYLHQTIKDL